MASRFIGRDYATLREEIISFLRKKLPNDWDWTNLSDPIVIFAESLARMGDQLHYTRDELRRECDISTAKRASSIYSYAMREGYKMMLPRASFGTLIVSSPLQSSKLKLKIKKFDAIPVTNTGDTLYAAEDVEHILYAPLSDEYAQYVRDNATGNPINENASGWYNYTGYIDTEAKRITRVPVVLGTLETFNFTYSDINSDSTVDIPDAIIDRNLLSLVRKSSGYDDMELSYVDDIIGSGFSENSFTITPKFIGGAISLVIEFPSNYKDLFRTSDSFSFRYIRAIDKKIDDTEENARAINLNNYVSVIEEYEEDQSIVDNGMLFEISLADGIKGYSEFENPNVTRENYKKYVQSYSSLLTKDDYAAYIKSSTSQHCQVFDHADNYRLDKVPPNTELIPRTVYIITDADFDGRKMLWNDLKERSSRSDCIVLIPYGKDPYSIVVKAECYLLGTSVSAVATQIKKALLEYYTVDPGEKVPEISRINYVVHNASDKVIRMDSCIVRDSTFGTIDNTFNKAFELDNDDVDTLYSHLSTGIRCVISDVDIDTGVTPEDGPAYVKYEPVEYKPFPESFTKVFILPSDGDHSHEVPVEDYMSLLEHQAAYNDLDSKNFDRKDEEIFSTTLESGANYRHIDDYYIKHHYMVPVLNNVIVLIKAVTR